MVTIVQMAVLIWYLLLGIEQHVLNNSLVKVSTDPQINFLPHFSMNFTIAFERASPSRGSPQAGAIPILRVNDSFLDDTVCSW